jgi:hypothetical protein
MPNAKLTGFKIMSCASNNIAPVMAWNRGIGNLGSAESTSTNTRPHDTNKEKPSLVRRIEFWRRNFAPRDYVDSLGKIQKSYEK